MSVTEVLVLCRSNRKGLLEEQLGGIPGQHTADESLWGLFTGSLHSNLLPQAHSRPHATCHQCPRAGSQERGYWWDET